MTMSSCEEKVDSPADLNLFVEDLLEQMVRLFVGHCFVAFTVIILTLKG